MLSKSEPTGSRLDRKRWPEKQAYAWVLPPAPQTNTGARVEETKAYERMYVKELGNIATVTSE